jgi:hypothetical protein
VGEDYSTKAAGALEGKSDANSSARQQAPGMADSSAIFFRSGGLQAATAHGNLKVSATERRVEIHLSGAALFHRAGRYPSFRLPAGSSGKLFPGLSPILSP